MKKLIFPILLLILTGCSSDALNGYITVNCVKEQNYNNTKSINKVEVRYKDNEVIDLTIHELYESTYPAILDAYKQSLIAESNQYKNIEITKNESSTSYEMIYKITKENFNTELIEKFNIEKLANNQIKYYENLGYSCK